MIGENKYFLKGLIKILIYTIGIIVWFVPMSFMLLWTIITACGGLVKSIDEYVWADNWMKWFKKRNDDLWTL